MSSPNRTMNGSDGRIVGDHDVVGGEEAGELGPSTPSPRPPITARGMLVRSANTVAAERGDEQREEVVGDHLRRTAGP